jgi:hypothetical protein
MRQPIRSLLVFASAICPSKGGINSFIIILAWFTYWKSNPWEFMIAGSGASIQKQALDTTYREPAEAGGIF